MTPGPVVVPARVFAGLSRGRATPEGCDLLLRAQHSKHLLLLRVVLDETVRRRHPQAAATRDAYDLLTAVESAAPAATARVIRYPTVGTWALRTVWHLLQGHPPEACGAAQPYRLAALAASAALLGGVDLTVDLPAPNGLIHLPAVGTLPVPHGRTSLTAPQPGLARPEGAVPPGALRVGAGDVPMARLHVRADGVVVVNGVPVELRPLRGVDAPPGAVIDDLDPFRFPDGARPARRLTPERVAAWTGPLTAGWELLLDRHPDVATEVGRLISVLVPLTSPRRRMSSASSRACFGGVALSRPPDPLNAALTFAHEVQHVKLSALIDLFPLVAPDTRLYYAPWREDPRPLHGLLHGTYAFMGVAEFWERQRHHDTGLDAHAKFARWREAAAETVSVLLYSGALTELGQEFVTGMGDRLDELAKESVPPHAVTLARRALARHRERWLRAHG